MTKTVLYSRMKTWCAKAKQTHQLRCMGHGSPFPFCLQYINLSPFLFCSTVCRLLRQHNTMHTKHVMKINKIITAVC